MDITIIHIDTQNIKSNISRSLYKSKILILYLEFAFVIFIFYFCAKLNKHFTFVNQLISHTFVNLQRIWK